MTTASTRVWTFATVLIVIVMIALGWFLGAAPQFANAARAELERQEAAAQNIALRAATDALAADFAAISQLREELAEVQAEFPPFAEYDEFSETLLTELVAAGVELDSVQVSLASVVNADVVPDETGRVPAGTLLRIPVSITVNGDASTALRFIDALQRSERFTFVNAVSLSDGASDAPFAVISVIYYVVSEAPVVVDADTSDDGGPAETEPSPTPTP